MRPFSYIRFTFKEGREVHREVVDLNREDIRVLQQGGGELGFLRLLSNWNRVSARGGDRTSVLYVYTAEERP